MQPGLLAGCAGARTLTVTQGSQFRGLSFPAAASPLSLQQSPCCAEGGAACLVGLQSAALRPWRCSAPVFFCASPSLSRSQEAVAAHRHIGLRDFGRRLPSSLAIEET